MPAAETEPRPVYRVPLLRFVSAPIEQLVSPLEEDGIDRGAMAAAGGLLLLAALGGAFVTALARRELWGRAA